jgi:hypothetical protein
LHQVGKTGYARKSFDIISAFSNALGKKITEIPKNDEQGDFQIHTAV